MYHWRHGLAWRTFSFYLCAVYGAGLHAQYAGTYLYTTGQGLPFNETAAVYADESGTLWVSTNSDGIYRFDGVDFTRIPVPAKSAGRITPDGQGGVWFSDANTGAYHHYSRDGEARSFPTARGLPSDSLFYSAHAPDGNRLLHLRNKEFWVYNENSIYRYNPARSGFERLDSLPLPAAPGTYYLQPDPWNDNHLLFHRDRNGDVGYYLRKGAGWALLPLPEKPAPGVGVHCQKFLKDNVGAFIQGAGAFRFDGQSWRPLPGHLNEQLKKNGYYLA